MHPGAAGYCTRGGSGVKPRPMIRYFDMDDRARLPWRFFGESLSLPARR